MVRVVIHVGMHKTGSSAIQNFFAAQPFRNFEYATWNAPNHCGLFMLLFEDPVQARNYHGFQARGPAFLDSLPGKRNEWQGKLDEQMDRLAGTDTTLLVSAEDISEPGFVLARRNLRDYFVKRADEVQVIGYVRPPLSYARSAFQQRLKGSVVRSLDIDTLWPAYRARFEDLDHLFGSDIVKLKIYAKDALYRGDIVSDFGRILGFDIAPPAKTAMDNETLSAEATALLFIQRKLGSGFLSGTEMAYAYNERFLTELRRIGRRSFTFAPEAWGPVVDHHAEDLAWMERRLGQKLTEPAVGDALPIRSEEDLIELSSAQCLDLETVVLDCVRSTKLPTRKKTVLLLELLQKAGHF